MEIKLLSALLILASLGPHSLGLSFIDEHTPKDAARKAEFKVEMDKLWEKHTRSGPNRPTIQAFTFGNANSTIQGKEMETYYGETIYAYQGLRYANAERFQLPVLEDQYWEDEYKAIHIGPMCPQIGMVSHMPTGSEDCLFLNVYSPIMPGEELLPVMFFIHGGGFTNGDSSYYLPTKLLDHPVILVTIHYRLGTLGFFFMNDDEAPGNYALYDQSKALDWVQEHISDFGGDKDRVTVFGQSAGGTSVAYMQFVTQAKGKMQGIISQSGSSIDVWSVDMDPMYATNYVSEYAGCGSYENISIGCLRNVSSDVLVEATADLVSTDRKNGYMGFRGVSPTIQGPDVTDPILKQHPLKYFQNKEINDVPQMMGTVKQEGSFVLGVMYSAYLVPNGLVGNSSYMYERMIPDIIQAMGVFDVSNSLSVSCGLEYCPDIDLADFEVSSYCLIDMTGALFLKGGSWETANLLSYYGTKPVYAYSFDYMSEDSMAKWIIGDTPFETGVTHSDDLMYLFPMPVVLNGSQITTQDRMTLLWTNFATYLDPTPSQDDEMEQLDLPQWFSYKFEDTYYMLMRDEFIVQEDFLQRWTITVDEMNAGYEVSEQPPILSSRAFDEDATSTSETTEVSNSISTSSSTTDTSTTTTTVTTATSESPLPVTENYQDDYDKAAEEADAYMAAMLSFIFATCVAAIIAVYFYSKSRKTA